MRQPLDQLGAKLIWIDKNPEKLGENNKDWGQGECGKKSCRSSHTKRIICF